MVEIFRQFKNLKETLEASLANNAVPPAEGTATSQATKSTGSGNTGAPTAPAPGGTKADAVRDRTRSPDSKRRAVGEKGDDMEA